METRASSSTSDESEGVSLDVLTHVYRELVDTGTSELLDEHFVALLRSTALECRPRSARRDLHELLLRKRYALKCLYLISYQFSDNFCVMVYDTITMILFLTDSDLIENTGLSKLNEFMNSGSPLRDKVLLLQSLATCLSEGDVNFGVFERFPSDVWRRQVLLSALLGAAGAGRALDLRTVQAVSERVDKLAKFLLDAQVEWNVEDVLEKLISFQKNDSTNIYFITDVLIVILAHPEIYYELEQNVITVKEKINEFKFEALLNVDSDLVVFLSEYYFDTLQYIMTFPLQITFSILMKMMASDNFERVVSFVDMLKYSAIEQPSLIDFLAGLDFHDEIVEMTYKLFFQIIRRVIGEYFPYYRDYGKTKYISSYKELSKVFMNCNCLIPKLKCELHQKPEFSDLLYVLNCTLVRVFLSCTNANEQLLDPLRALISNIKTPLKLIEVLNALEILEEYKIEYTENEFRNLLSEFNSGNYEQKLHKLVVEHSFSGTYEKSAPQIIDEVENCNAGLTSHLSGLFIDVQSAYKNSSRLFPNGESISKWPEKQINIWASLAKENFVEDAEKIAVLKRAAVVTLGLHVRDVQLLTVISIVKSNVGKGRLIQVNTGEGKTLIIAMAAAFKVLAGHKIDIYTSSPVLAVPQSVEFNEFFKVCGISATHNIYSSANYNCDIIYGTNSSFQRDVLMDEFRKSGIRKGRKFDVAIVDEVDNMLIDGNNWILKLTCDMPAMDHLESLLAAIYIQVKAVASAIIEKNGVFYFREEDDIFEEDGDVKQEVKYRDIPINGSNREFIIKCTECHIRKLIRDTGDEEVEDNYPEIKIPKHLRKVISKIQVNGWIESAIESIFDYVQDEDYILENNKITIVDVNNTGVLKKNSHWCNGLHQFLQIKHGAKLEPENFTSNFISNVALFTRYSSVFGLTGTLGNTDTRNFLQVTYDVDTIIIPPFKLKQHKELQPVILNDTENWYFEIARNCVQKLRNGRAVLIIMKFIRETEELAKVFKERFHYDSQIKLYKTDSNSEVISSPLSPGDVIITTNIAGRGADIKLKNSVEKNGGLHVCLTFVPKNSRVEVQNVGRTSRKGNRGTSQLILCISNSDSSNIVDIKNTRSKMETSSIKSAMTTVQKIKIKDKIFRQFCDVLTLIEGRNSFVKKTEIKSVEEEFSIWLKLHQNKPEKELEKEFKKFTDTLKTNDKRGKLIQNPYLYVEVGNKYLKGGEFTKAIFEYSEAIDLDPNFAENAFYNRAWAYLQLYGDNVSENKYYIQKAVSDLQDARKLIQEKENGLHLLQTASNNAVFSEQVTTKLNLYNIQKNVIEMAIGPDTDSIDKQLEEIKTHLKQTKDIPPEVKKSFATLKSKLEEDRENIGVIRRAVENNRDIKIEPLPEDYIPKADKDTYEDELEEFERNGWLPGFKISEVKPIDWLSVFCLLGIGLGQLIIGAAITVFSLGSGAYIGMSFISEGVSDIITAVKDGIINRDFNWATWALMKVISLTVSIVCAGLKAIKDVARTAYSGVKNIATAGFKAFNKATTEGFKIAAKKLGFELAKGVSKEIVTQLVTYGIDKSLIPKLEEAIIEIVRGPIEKNLTENSKLKLMLQLDEKNKDKTYENQIRTIGYSLLSPKRNSLFKTLAQHTASCITGNLGLGTVHKIVTILEGSTDLILFTNKFIEDFNKKIDKIAIKDENLPDEKMEENIQEESLNASKAVDKNEDINLNEVRKQCEQVQVQKKSRLCTPKDLTNEFAGAVSTNMIQIMKGSIVSPITQMAVSYSIDGLSSEINKSLEATTEKYRAAKRICDNNNRNYEDTSLKIDTQTLKEEEFNEVNSLIDKIEEGGPVGLVHLGALSKAADIPIEVYDHNGDLMFPVRNNQGGEPIQLQYHDNGTSLGHFTLLGKNEPLAAGAGDNMCAFNCVAQLCNKDPNQLKQDTVNILRANHHVLATQLNDIKLLETCKNSVFSLKGGASYYGKNYLDAMQYITSSEGKCGYKNKNAGHPEVHISYKGDTKIRLAMVSEAIGKKIIVKNKKGNEMFTTGTQFDGPPIIMEYHVDKKDPANSYFKEPKGNEKLVFNHNDDSKFYSHIGKITKMSPDDIKTSTNAKLENFSVPPDATCVENKQPSAGGKLPTGFFSKEDEGLVLDCVMKTEVAKNKLANLNDTNNNIYKIPLTVSVKDLNLPRPVKAGEWRDGRLVCEFPINSVFVLLQHHDGQQNNPEAQVQIQTIYPPS